MPRRASIESRARNRFHRSRADRFSFLRFSSFPPSLPLCLPPFRPFCCFCCLPRDLSRDSLRFSFILHTAVPREHVPVRYFPPTLTASPRTVINEIYNDELMKVNETLPGAFTRFMYSCIDTTQVDIAEESILKRERENLRSPSELFSPLFLR